MVRVEVALRTVKNGRFAREIEAALATEFTDRVWVPTKIDGLARRVDEDDRMRSGRFPVSSDDGNRYVNASHIFNNQGAYPGTMPCGLSVPTLRSRPRGHAGTGGSTFSSCGSGSSNGRIVLPGRDRS